MKPPIINNEQEKLFAPRLSSIINPKHPLEVLAKQIDWNFFDKEFGSLYKEKGAGQPPKPTRLMVGLLMVQHMEKLSDEQVVNKFVGDVYLQRFCGYDYFQWEKPIDPSSLTRFRYRLGETGVKKILHATVKQAVQQKVIKAKDLTKVVADTTVMEKNVAYPTDSVLLNKMRQKLVRLAQKVGLPLRQNYNRVAAKLVVKVGKYAHAKQFKRMKRTIKSLRTYLGRIVRDIQRQIQANTELNPKFSSLIEMAKKLIEQVKTSKNKIYSIHEPKVYCIAKGKTRTPYEFGVKVAFVTTQKKGIVLSADALEKNEYDGHTLANSLQKAEEASQTAIQQVLVDKGYRKHGVEDKNVYMSGQKKGITRHLKGLLRKRASIEAHFSHMKSEGKLKRNFLKGFTGDTINAILCGVGHNLRQLIIKNYSIILGFLLVLYAWHCIRVPLQGRHKLEE